MSPDIAKCSFGNKIALVETMCDNSYVSHTHEKEETFESVQLLWFISAFQIQKLRLVAEYSVAFPG